MRGCVPHPASLDSGWGWARWWKQPGSGDRKWIAGKSIPCRCLCREPMGHAVETLQVVLSRGRAEAVTLASAWPA